MGNVLFTNVRIIDGSGAAPFAGEVLVQGNRIARITRGGQPAQVAGATVVDGGGATLMPGMTEAHTHFSWNNALTLQGIQLMPTEEHVLWNAGVAKVYLDHGFTSCVGAATAKPRLDVVIRNAINAGQIPGPRYLAASQEITVAGSLGDELLPHLPYPEFIFASIVSGPEEMRKVVRAFLKDGADIIKLNVSGDNLSPPADAKTAWMSDAEVGMAVEETHLRGKRVSVHARSCQSVKQAMRFGCDIINHVSYTDEEALDMLEAAKNRIFVMPTFSVIVRLLYEGEEFGWPHARGVAAGYPEELEALEKSMRALHKRGVRVLPGGDYGFAWARHGENAKDLGYMVKYVGMTPMEAIVAATKHGGAAMMMGDRLGQVKEGFLADLLLVDGDPVADLSILLDTRKFLAIMKDGVFHKDPALLEGRQQRSRTAAE